MPGTIRKMRLFVSKFAGLLLVVALAAGSGLNLQASAVYAKTDSGAEATTLEVRALYRDRSEYETIRTLSMDYFTDKSSHFMLSFADALPTAGQAEADGVQLNTILSDCNIKEGDVRSFTFHASDGSKTLSADAALESGCFFPALEDVSLWEPAEGGIKILNVAAASEGMKRVSPILAWQNDWYRFSNGPNGMTGENRFNLLFGMEDFSRREDGYIVKSAASKTMKWIWRIDLDLNVDAPKTSGSSGGSSGGSNSDGGNSGSDDTQRGDGADGGGATVITGSAMNTSPAKAAAPTDIAGHWGEDSIVKMVEIGAVSGNPDGTFLPNSEVSRAQFISMLIKTMVKADRLVLDARADISDAGKHWAKTYLSTAVLQGIMMPQHDGSVSPDRQITREEMAVMLARALNLSGDRMKVTLADGDQVSSWALDAVVALLENGGMTGFPDGTFQPKENATKAQAAASILRTFTSAGLSL